MTNTQKAIDLIKLGGMQRITKVPKDLYQATLEDFPEGARTSINVEQTNLIVYQGLYAIACDDCGA